MKQWKMQTPLGLLYLVASSESLLSVYFDERQDVGYASSLKDADAGILARAVNQLEEYFRRERRTFDLPAAAEGTEFQRRVWKELSKIPYGQTVSYTDIARQIGNEKAVRAVGTANGRNPLSIVVPCHRVIAADGTLGGYAGGLENKTKLLELERSEH